MYSESENIIINMNQKQKSEGRDISNLTESQRRLKILTDFVTLSTVAILNYLIIFVLLRAVFTLIYLYSSVRKNAKFEIQSNFSDSYVEVDWLTYLESKLYDYNSWMFHYFSTRKMSGLILALCVPVLLLEGFFSLGPKVINTTLLSFFVVAATHYIFVLIKERRN